MVTRSHRIIMLMRTLLIAVLCIAPLAGAEGGFTSLFNGTDLRGWALVYKSKSTKGYLVKDNMIVCPADGGGNLLTVKEYANFIFRFEFLTSPGGNSGVGIWAPLAGDVSRTGIEIQILDQNNEKYKGWLKPWQHHGSIYGIIPAQADALKPAGEWNAEEILVNGRRIVVTLNGKIITNGDLDSVTDPKIIGAHPGMMRSRGHIGFLGHGSLVEFRNIRIRELP